MINQTRIYFIRTRNRSRILETLACRIVDGRLVFGIARAPKTDSSPSRKKGREEAMKRMDEAAAAYVNGDKFVYRRPHAKEEGVEHSNINIMGGTLNLCEIVPVLHNILLGNASHAYNLVPRWAYEQDLDCLGHFPEYHDMLCKLRNQVEQGKF